MIITFEDYLADQDCPELCNNDAFTFIDRKDADYDDEWDNFADDWETHA